MIVLIILVLCYFFGGGGVIIIFLCKKYYDIDLIGVFFWKERKRVFMSFSYVN